MSPAAAGPVASRAHLPDGYGLPKKSRVLEWTEIDARFESAMHYWICTVGDSMQPRPRPIDGMWLDERLYFGGDPASKWKRDLESNPKVAVHLDDPDRAVIAEGTVRIDRPDRQLAERLVAASNAKYHMGQKVEQYEGEELNVFVPSRVLAWNTLYEDATRFDFPP